MTHPQPITTPSVGDRGRYTCPMTLLEVAPAQVHLDIQTLGVPALLREELALRRHLSERRPGRHVVERLAAIEARFAREGTR